MTRLFCIGAAGVWVRLFVCILLAVCSMSSAIVRHNDNPINGGTPPNAVIGKWYSPSTASCVVIGKRYVITTKHQGGGAVAGTIVAVGGTNYTVAQEFDIATATDIRVARIKEIDSGLANLSQFSLLYSGSYPNNTPMIIGGFGDIRGAELRDGTNKLYGYTWITNPDSTTPVWGTNQIEMSLYFPSQNILSADFDGSASSTEGALADHDSGSGWFISNAGVWKLVGLTFAVDTASVPFGESWFLNPRSNFYAHWLNSYVSTIQNAITAPAIPTGISATAGSGCGEILLSWNSVSDVDGYRVYYSQNPAELILYSNVSSAQTSITIGSLTPNEIYNFAVTAYKGIAESDYSSIIAATASTNCQYQISGYVMDSNSPVQGVTVNASNVAANATTDSQGYYSLPVPYGWSGSITPSKLGYDFIPQSLTYTNVTTDLTGQNFDINSPLMIDDFNDNTRSANWLDVSRDYANINVIEANEVLQFTSTYDACDVKACYQSNEWLIDTNANFSMKIDFHHLVADTNGNFAYLKLIRDANNYAYIGIGSDAGVQYYEMQVIENSDVNAVRHTVPVASDGKLYVYYNRSSDYLYLSLSDYGTTTNGILSKGVLADGWASQPAKIEIGLTSNNCQILPGEITFDNFVVNTGNISGWPPRTDVNRDGFIDIEDLGKISDYWLTNDPNTDIDESGIVDFVDFARLAEVW